MGNTESKVIGLIPTVLAVGIMDKTVKMVKKW